MHPRKRIVLGLLLALSATTLLNAKIKKGTPSPGAKTYAPIEASMRAGDCFVCHSYSHKLVGPAFKDVADRYRSDPQALDHLVAKVQAGGAGAWGRIQMAPHKVKPELLRTMVAWVLART